MELTDKQYKILLAVFVIAAFAAIGIGAYRKAHPKETKNKTE